MAQIERKFVGIPQDLNPSSLQRLTGCCIEPSVQAAQPGDRYQFERNGYFCVDPDASPSGLVFNRTVSMRDTWAKIEKATVPHSSAASA